VQGQSNNCPATDEGEKMQNNLADVRQRWDKAKPTKTITFWIVIGAIILTVFLGFSKGGWVTAGTSQQSAEKIAQTAVTERLTSICVAQFNQDPAKDQKLVEMKAIGGSTQRTTYVKDQGWAMMPGEETPDGRVATECTKQLMLLGE
jgi:hypothetical protein